MSSGLVGASLIISLLVLFAFWIFIEIKTLKDNIPGNHITAVVRAAVRTQPGPFIAFMFLLGFLCGHLFWP